MGRSVEKFVKGELPKFQEHMVRPKIPNLKIIVKKPVQKDLFSNNGNSEFRSPYGLRGALGFFYELISKGLMGGHLRDNWRYDCTNKKEKPNNNGFYVFCCPDVCSVRKDVFFESKAFGPTAELKLRDDQMEKYALLQLDPQHKNPARIYFSLFRHGIRDLQKNFKKKRLGELVKNLTNSTLFSIILPLSVTEKIHEVSLEGGYAGISRYDGDKFEHITRIWSGKVNNLFQKPQEFLESIDLNPDDYLIKRSMLQQDSLFVNGWKVKSFPILAIDDKNFEQWLKRFYEKYDDQRKRLKEEYLEYVADKEIGEFFKKVGDEYWSKREQ